MKEIINKIKRDVGKYFSGSCPSHDWSHVDRVYDLAQKIAEKEKANLFIVKLAALLHDIGRKKESEFNGNADHAKISAEIAKKILKKYRINGDITKQVLHCVLSHRFRKGNIPKTIEAKVLFDADKLDCIGAIGVARAYSCAGNKGLKLYSDKDFLGTGYEKEHSPVTEFLYKLSKVKNKMQTKTGKKIALERHKYMENYFYRLNKEISKT